MTSTETPALPASRWDAKTKDTPHTEAPPIVSDGNIDLEVVDFQETPAQDAVKVVVRVRPPLPRELNGYRPFQNAISVDSDRRALTLSENLGGGPVGADGLIAATHGFTYDRVYPPETTQAELYDECAKPAVQAVLSGYNASVIAYGQTGAGKTFTMEGCDPLSPPTQSSSSSINPHLLSHRGIIPRAIEDLYSQITLGSSSSSNKCLPSSLVSPSSGSAHSKFLVRASYLQIYNEIISDLLKPDGKAPPGGLQIREDKKRGLFVDGLSEWVVRSPEEVYELMRRGAKMRATGATKLNEASSRSHAIFILIVERTTGINSSSCSSSGGGGKGHSPNGSSGTKDGPVIVGKLNLVDLAGSERVAVTGAKGQRLEESKRINSSLSALGNVIAALTDPHAAAAAHAALAARGGLSSRDHHYHPHQNQKAIRHIPYRDSKLTRILEDSLGGNCRTTFLACVSPAAEAFSETLSTLKFAKRTKKVRNAPKINEDGSDHATLLRKYERELRRLRAELASKSKDLVDKRLILEVEEARRREQADKIAAITALERQSQEIARHKAAMAALQTRIASMQSQLLISGQGGGGMAGGGNGGANGGGGGGLKGSVKDNPQVKSLLAAEQAKIRAEYEARLKELEEERRSVAENKAQTERLKSLVIKQRDIMLALASRLSERDDQVLALQSRAEAAEEEVKQLEDKLDAKNAQVISLLRIQQQARNGGGGGGGGGEEEEEEEDGWTISSNTAATNNNGGSTTVPQLEGPQQVTPDMFTDDDDGSRPTSRHGSSSSSDTKDDGEHQQQKEQVSAVKSTTSKSVVDTVASDQKKKKKKNAVPSHQQQEEEEEEELRRRYTVMQEERMALRTILGQKIGVIVDDALATVVEAGKKQQHNGEIMVVQLKKQLEYLSRLVWATADALHEEGQ